MYRLEVTVLLYSLVMSWSWVYIQQFEWGYVVGVSYCLILSWPWGSVLVGWLTLAGW